MAENSILKVQSPVDGSILLERAAASVQEIDGTLSRLREGQTKWASLSLDIRLEYLQAFVDRLMSKSDLLAPELSSTMGRPIAFSPGEFRGFRERAEKMIELASESLKSVTIDEYRYIERRPLGVVFVIAAWNYPYLIAVNAVVAALAAGNSVLLKHSQQTLICAERFLEAFQEANIPPGVFEILHLSHEATESIVRSAQIDLVNFTGSVDGGRAIHRAAAGTFAPVGLELGGKDPAFVRRDANLEFAAESLADGAFFNSGQSCCGIERIYVDHKVYDEFLDLMCWHARKLKLGLPTDPETTLGPMVRPQAADFVRRQVQDAVNQGAEALLRLGPGEGSFLPPEILIQVHHGMEVMTEETFGPVVGVMPVESDEEAVLLMNDSRYGLTASIWTADLHRAGVLGRQLHTGTVFCNRCDYLDPELAWTGVKDSGRGCTLSRVGYEHLTRPKSYHLRKAPPQE